MRRVEIPKSLFDGLWGPESASPLPAAAVQGPMAGHPVTHPGGRRRRPFRPWPRHRRWVRIPRRALRHGSLQRSDRGCEAPHQHCSAIKHSHYLLPACPPFPPPRGCPPPPGRPVLAPLAGRHRLDQPVRWPRLAGLTGGQPRTSRSQRSSARVGCAGNKVARRCPRCELPFGCLLNNVNAEVSRRPPGCNLSSDRGFGGPRQASPVRCHGRLIEPGSADRAAIRVVYTILHSSEWPVENGLSTAETAPASHSNNRTCFTPPRGRIRPVSYAADESPACRPTRAAAHTAPPGPGPVPSSWRRTR